MSVIKKSVLIPIDFSELSYQAIATAKEYVEDIAYLNLIHVLTPLHPADPAAMWNTLNDDERKHKVSDFLQTKLEEMGYSGAKISVAIGDPSTEIVDYAAEIGADLIIMPSHGRKGVSRFLLGSVAERVVRLSPCPVLILK
ncbi:universal stress protein [Myxosarcina sp. GI1]|uniref:universal stress protein n=1 Tax=Myxosarcina sp. GI1 TaxID=1541065 RepID=UPI00056761FA|nr:universal stress protein [Myxosarcina sp. GI1]